MKRLAAFLGFFLFLLFSHSVSAAECQFVLGFKVLRDLIGHETVGECLDNEHHGANGDALQQTTGGLLDWRKADNWTAFTDGYRTWIDVPTGLVQRFNTERFEWEADYAPGGGIATPTPTPTPVAAVTPAPTSTPRPMATPAVTPTPSLVDLAKASPWNQDGLDGANYHGGESQSLRALKEIERSNPQLAEEMSGWAWIFDKDMNSHESVVIGRMAGLVSRVPQLVPRIAGYSWLRDSVDRWEARSIDLLYSTAINYDLDFAEELAAAPWVVDGVTLIESHFGINGLRDLSGIPRIEHASPAVARQILGLMPDPVGEVDFFLVDSLRNIAWNNPDGLERLLRARWYRDGLDEE